MLHIQHPRIPLLSQLEAVPYKYSSRLRIPKKPGIYLIHDLRGVVYISQSANLRNSLVEWVMEQGPWALVRALRKPIGQFTFSWIELEPAQLAGSESSLIKIFSPPFNQGLFGVSTTD